jgi:hypothetical protein
VKQRSFKEATWSENLSNNNNNNNNNNKVIEAKRILQVLVRLSSRWRAALHLFTVVELFCNNYVD